MLGILYLAGTGISLGMSGVLGVARGAGSAVGGAAGGLTDLTSGDLDQMLARLNDPKTAGVVAGATGMSQDEARSALGDIRQRVEAARNNPEQAAAEARNGVQQLNRPGEGPRGERRAAGTTVRLPDDMGRPGGHDRFTRGGRRRRFLGGRASRAALVG